MKNLFEKDSLNETLSRIENLNHSSQALWGKMNVAQVLAHCSAALEVAVGNKFPPRIFIGRILGPVFKSSFLNKKPFTKNTPTDKSFIISNNRNFEEEKERLIQLIKQFHDGGTSKCTTHPHSFFGKLTPEQWSVGMYKHLDHHLKQFGV